MISESSAMTTPEMEPAPMPPTLDALRARLVSLGSGAPPGGQTQEAAITLLAAERLGQNIDRLARFTGIPRERIARFARRLVDNGVWHNGHTVSPWVDVASDKVSFWADVAVAEGESCRRIGDDGMPEWAPQGYWRKHYEYVAPRDEEPPQVICYHPHVEVLSQEIPFVVEDDEEEVEPPARERRMSVDRRDRAAAGAPPPTIPDDGGHVWLGGEEVVRSDEESAVTTSESSGPSLFPEAVWLG